MMSVQYLSVPSFHKHTNTVQPSMNATKSLIASLPRDMLQRFHDLLQSKSTTQMNDETLLALVKSQMPNNTMNSKAQKFVPMVPHTSLDSISEEIQSNYEPTPTPTLSAMSTPTASPCPSPRLTPAPSPAPSASCSSFTLSNPISLLPAYNLQQVNSIVNYHLNSLARLPHPQDFALPKHRTREETGFKPRYEDHAKGNFFIAPDVVKDMMGVCQESFVAPEPTKLAFSVFKESVAMQVNDNQIFVSRDFAGKNVIFIDIDLHKRGTMEKFYLEARENDVQFQDRVKWKIVGFKTRMEIARLYGITQLPQSSRGQKQFLDQLKRSPVNMTSQQVKQMLEATKFKKLPAKMAKPRSKAEKKKVRKVRIKDAVLRNCCFKAFERRVFIPVVVMKGNEHYVEWKVPVQIFNENNQAEWVCISLRFCEKEGQWKVECMDYDHGRVYYQHRLISLPVQHTNTCDWDTLKKYVTTALHILQ